MNERKDWTKDYLSPAESMRAADNLKSIETSKRILDNVSHSDSSLMIIVGLGSLLLFFVVGLFC